MQRAYVSVINDLSTDQRVHRTCTTLHKLGYDVLLIGRRLPGSIPPGKREYKCKRMYLLFTKGPVFYLMYNIRLFFLLLFKKRGLLFSNDLDTLPANFLVSKLKACPLVYDSHEYFTEVPELQNSPFKKKVWENLEKFMAPKLKHCITVNTSIAGLYKKKYGIDFSVVRNVPFIKNPGTIKSRKELGLPADKNIIILQGSGINIQRGAEEAVEAMQYVENSLLLIIGGGDVIGLLKKICFDLHLENKIQFIHKLPYGELLQYTGNSNIGLTLDKDTNINYRYSLPNKIFDYIHCNVPVLGSNLPEIKNIIETYNVGTTIQSHDPKHIAEKINFMLSDKPQLEQWKQNCSKAAAILNWEREQIVLTDIIKKIQ